MKIRIKHLTPVTLTFYKLSRLALMTRELKLSEEGRTGFSIYETTNGNFLVNGKLVLSTSEEEAICFPTSQQEYLSYNIAEEFGYVEKSLTSFTYCVGMRLESDKPLKNFKSLHKLFSLYDIELPEVWIEKTLKKGNILIQGGRMFLGDKINTTLFGLSVEAKDVDIDKFMNTMRKGLLNDY